MISFPAGFWKGAGGCRNCLPILLACAWWWRVLITLSLFIHFTQQFTWQVGELCEPRKSTAGSTLRGSVVVASWKCRNVFSSFPDIIVKESSSSFSTFRRRGYGGAAVYDECVVIKLFFFFKFLCVRCYRTFLFGLLLFLFLSSDVARAYSSCNQTETFLLQATPLNSVFYFMLLIFCLF